MKTTNILFLSLLSTILVLSCQQKPGEDTMKIIVFTKTDGYRHDSIPEAVQALEQLCGVNNWNMIHTEDSLFFTKSNLKSIDVVIFLHTIGNIFGDTQKKAIEEFVIRGGGLVTIHTGTVTENEWQWFSEAIGARFIGHPPEQRGKLIIEDRSHPSTEFFPDSVWIIKDEWYSFDRNPRKDVHVLISIDEMSYDVDDNRWFEGVNQRMGDHPLVWYKEVDKGTVFQTALGHPAELYSDSLFIKHLEGAILCSAGLK
jgi:uncharacterized protein